MLEREEQHTKRKRQVLGWEQQINFSEQVDLYKYGFFNLYANLTNFCHSVLACCIYNGRKTSLLPAV